MAYRRGTANGEGFQPSLFADYAVLSLALDRMIAEGDREIARLTKVLTELSGTEPETARGAECQTRAFDEGGVAVERRADFIIPFCAGEYAVRRRAA